MNIVFMGTPEFGATILQELVKEHNVVLAVTQPDKLVGRKREIEFSAVKKKAQELNIPVFQPIIIRKEYQYIIDNFEFDTTKKRTVAVTFTVHTVFGDVKTEKAVEY